MALPSAHRAGVIRVSMGMDQWGKRSATEGNALESIAVVMTVWLAASAVRADLDFIWQSLAILFKL